MLTAGRPCGSPGIDRPGPRLKRLQSRRIAAQDVDAVPGPVEDADVQMLEIVGFLVENGGFHGVEILAAVIQQDGLGRVEGDGVDQFTILPFENR